MANLFDDSREKAKRFFAALATRNRAGSAANNFGATPGGLIKSTVKRVKTKGPRKVSGAKFPAKSRVKARIREKGFALPGSEALGQAIGRTSVGRKFTREFTKPRNIPKAVTNPLVDTAFAVRRLNEGLTAVPFAGRDISAGTLGLPGINELPSAPATSFGKVLGNAANLVPAAMLLRGSNLGGKDILTKGKFAGGSAALGGIFNKAFGGSFSEGAVEGFKNAPGIGFVGFYSNPIISQLVGRGTPINSPIIKQLAGRSLSGALNVIEGVPMNVSIGGKAFDTVGAFIDFSSGFLLTNPNDDIARTRLKEASAQYLASGNKQIFENAIRDLQASGIKLKASALKEFRRVMADEAGKIDFNAKVSGDDLDKEFLEGRREIEKMSQEELISKSVTNIGKGGTLDPVKAEEFNKETGRSLNEGLKGDPNKAFNINKERLGVSELGAEDLDNLVESIRPVLEGNRGRTLSHSEIIEGASKASLLNEVVNRDQTKAFAESLTASRKFVRAEAEATGLTPEYVRQAQVISSQAADIGRSLNAFKISGKDAGIKSKTVKDLVKIGVEADKIVEGAKGVDWSDQKQVTDFFRKFKPATFNEKLTEFRYVNMLSSPNTHLVNAASNLIQTGLVAPVEKAVAGAIDFVKSTLTGSEREYYVRQGVDYVNGYFKALPTAWSRFADAFKSGASLKKPDIDTKQLPLDTSTLRRIYTAPLTALEASDVFFRTLSEGGEFKSNKRAGMTDIAAKQKAEKTAEYRIFRQAFDPDGKLGNNRVLQIWDQWNSGVANLRELPGGKWVVPFLQTPTNILKQGVEFSPLGVATVKGSAEPTVQLAKTAIGTSVFAGAYAMAEAGLVTWDAPVSSAEKDEFYAAGLQPYSVKIGDKWVSYSKLGPLSYPIAMAAVLKWAEDNGADQNALEKAGEALVGGLHFFADQSYVRSVGDVIDAFRGDEFKRNRAIANIPSQLIPYRAMLGWITRIVDPIYRKGEGVIGNIQTQIPILSEALPPYTTPSGEPSQRQFPVANAFLPFKVTQENPEGMAFFKERQKGREINKRQKAISDANQATAQQIVDQVSGMSTEQRNQTLLNLQRNGTLTKEVAKKIKAINSGTAGGSPEAVVRGIRTTSGRAEYIIGRHAELSPTEFNAFLKGLESSGILTTTLKNEIRRQNAQ